MKVVATLRDFRLPIRLPLSPLIEVESVQYRDGEDNVQTLAAANY